jgi:hypothetical protein
MISCGALLVLALIIFALRFLGIFTALNVFTFSPFFHDGTRKDEKILTPTPLSPEAITIFSSQLPVVTLSPFPPPANPSSFAGKESLYPLDIEGVVEEVNFKMGVIYVRDAKSKLVSLVYAAPSTRITEGENVLTFRDLKVTSIVHVVGERGRSVESLNAFSIDVTGAL